MAGFTCGSVRTMSPMTIVWSPAAWNAVHDVSPWNGCISAPSMTIPRSPRGTLTFAMPFFTSGVRPVILAMSAASGSTAPALLAVTTARISSGATQTIVFMVLLLPCSSFASSVCDAGPRAIDRQADRDRYGVEQGVAATEPCVASTLRPSVAFPLGEQRVERIVEERRLLDGLVVIASDQWETLGDRPHSGGLRCQADLIGKVGAVNDLCERAERGVAGTVLVNQRLERTTPHIVDVGIGGTRRIKPRCALAALNFRNVLRIDEQECGRGIDEPANEPSRRGAVHTDLLARHPLHADSLRLLREPRAERAHHASVDLVPVDVLHERVDVLRGRGPVVEMVGMLVHVEHEQGPAHRHVVHVVPRPVVVHLPGVQVVGEDHPTGSAGQAIGHLRELRAPRLVSAEPLGEELQGVPARPAIATQAVEVVLVEDYGSGAHEFLALQVSVDVWRQVFFRQ